MEGELLKWTNYLFGYKERFFVLKGDVVYYYITKGDKVKGKIHLLVATVNYLEEDPLKFEVDTGLNKLFLKALNPEDKINWVKALKMLKFTLEKKSFGNNNSGNNINSSNNQEEGTLVVRGGRNHTTNPNNLNTTNNNEDSHKKFSEIKDLANNLSNNTKELENLIKSNYELGDDEISMKFLSLLEQNAVSTS